MSDTEEVTEVEEKNLKEKAEIARKKLTSKQRRALDRSQKRKKVGSAFYELNNVKNRSARKKYRIKLNNRRRK